MDQIKKSLRQLTEAERGKVRVAVEAIQSGDLSGLDVRRLKGRDRLYRARVGDIRIIFQVTKQDVVITQIGRRDERTYRKP